MSNDTQNFMVKNITLERDKYDLVENLSLDNEHGGKQERRTITCVSRVTGFTVFLVNFHHCKGIIVTHTSSFRVCFEW